MATHPEILWAQRSSDTDEKKNVLFLTVNLPDIQEPTLEYDLQPTKISLKVKCGDPAKGIPEKDYAFSFDFFNEVIPEESSKRLTTRSFYLVLRKKETKAEYWPRLTKDKVKSAFIKTDFGKWVDEDEQDGEEKVEDDDLGPMGGMGGGMPPGMGMPGGMGGMGGPGGMDFEKMMASMGGMGGMGEGGGPSGFGPEGDDENDSDDDGPPPLEETEPAKV